jgi:hypothetical protein
VLKTFFILVLSLLCLFGSGSLQAQLYVLSYNNQNAVIEYNASTGALISNSLASAIAYPMGIAISGNNLYITNAAGTISEYNFTTGATINASLISGLVYAKEIVVSGNSLYVAYSAGPSGGTIQNTIGVYNATTGAAIHPTFISVPGDSLTVNFTISGNNLFVANGTITEYNATTGAVINASIGVGSGAYGNMAISGNDLYVEADDGLDEYNATTGALIKSAVIGLGYSDDSGGIAISGGELFFANDGDDTIDVYNITTGALIKSSLITYLAPPGQIVVFNVPPAITSANSATFNAGRAGSLTVTALGSPAPTFSATGLPSWATLNATTGILSGTPPNTTGSPFTINLTAANCTTPNSTQVLTLTVAPALAITSANSTTLP